MAAWMQPAGHSLDSPGLNYKIIKLQHSKSWILFPSPGEKGEKGDRKLFSCE
jgi:hypothetical protein